jgi:hypothetical protein
MPIVSITRLKVRGLRFMPSFAWHALRASSQVRRAAGFLDGGTANEKGLCFWTVTVWQDIAAMREFRNANAHMKAMPRLIAICEEASYAHWEQTDAALPSLDEVHRRMLADGKPSKVRAPTPRHAEGKTVSELVPNGFRRLAPKT